MEKLPKLQIACNTPVSEGMVVHTKNERLRTAAGAVLFLLANHPLDCRSATSPAMDLQIST
jgi:NADH-quinone oxidoreductase subunit G